MPSDVEVLYQLTNGLSFIHSLGLLHHRIKPSNALICHSTSNRQPQLKWSDFGYLVDGATYWGAPELRDERSFSQGQFQYNHCSFQCDTFILGCLFFYFLHRGIHPFGEEADIPNNIAQANPVNFNAANTNNITNGALYSTLIGRMIEPIPVDRIPLGEILQVLIYARHFDNRLSSQDQKAIIKYVNQFNAAGSTGKQKCIVRNIVHLAAMNQDSSELIGQLLENGGDANALDSYCLTPVHVATQNSSKVAVEIMHKLLTHGGSPNMATKWGRSPVHLVSQTCSIQSVDMLRMLLNAAGDPNVVDCNGLTPIHLAAKNMCSTSPKIVEELLAKGGRVNVKDKNGCSPVHCVARNLSSAAPDILRMLLVKAADTSLKDHFGLTALDYAASNISVWGPEVYQMLVANKRTTSTMNGCVIS